MTTEFDESGWEKRTIAEEPGLSELVELYSELGFETMIKDYSCIKGSSEECNTCLLVNIEKYKVIYTKK